MNTCIKTRFSNGERGMPPQLLVSKSVLQLFPATPFLSLSLSLSSLKFILLRGCSFSGGPCVAVQRGAACGDFIALPTGWLSHTTRSCRPHPSTPQMRLHSAPTVALLHPSSSIHTSLSRGPWEPRVDYYGNTIIQWPSEAQLGRAIITCIVAICSGKGKRKRHDTDESGMHRSHKM